jgi:hypothetical protein
MQPRAPLKTPGAVCRSCTCRCTSTTTTDQLSRTLGLRPAAAFATDDVVRIVVAMRLGLLPTIGTQPQRRRRSAGFAQRWFELESRRGSRRQPRCVPEHVALRLEPVHAQTSSQSTCHALPDRARHVVCALARDLRRRCEIFRRDDTALVCGAVTADHRSMASPSASSDAPLIASANVGCAWIV